MLETLELTDFAIVDRLRLDLAPGFNVLTGETGAGKSILVDAVALLGGGRADSGAIRAARDSALVQGFFRETEFASAGRRLVRSGRNTARIDGEVVTVGELAERVGGAVAIFGQHASQRLLDTAEQRAHLDRLLDDDAAEALTRYRAAFDELQRTENEIESLSRAARERERQLDVLRFQRDEIDAAELVAGEVAELEREAEALRHSERILQGVGRAAALLGDADPGALDLLAEAQRALDGAARHSDAAAALARDLRVALGSVEAVQSEAEGFAADVDLDPARLERVEARLARIDRLARKYGDGVEAILAFRADAARELERLENADASLEALEVRRAELAEEVERHGRRVGEGRRAAAQRLEAGVAPLLHRLDMPAARFEVTLDPTAAPTPHGLERVRFAFTANAGEPLAPLASVASGGELSRLMLAIHVVTGSDAPTLIFDEVDAGIGGATARAVGELLQRLSARHQVLVVTHLPQVAAYGDAQYRVHKENVGGRTVTRVARLASDARVDELARMLSGRVTGASRGNARELLERASGGAELRNDATTGVPSGGGAN